MHAITSHEIVAVNDDIMSLKDCETNRGIITATRLSGKKGWKLSAKDQEDRIVKHGELECETPVHHTENDHTTTRCDVVHAMCLWAHELSPNEFVTVKEPYWVEGEGDDAKTVYIRDLP
jgi:hypothetical protein